MKNKEFMAPRVIRLTFIGDEAVKNWIEAFNIVHGSDESVVHIETDGLGTYEGTIVLSLDKNLWEGYDGNMERNKP